jgi:HK97 family phage major capsid protein
MADPVSNDDLLQKMNEAVKTLREKSETFGAQSAEVKQIQANIEEISKKYDEVNDQLVKQIEIQKTEAEKAAERIEDLEKTVARKSAESPSDYKNSEEYKQLTLYAKYGDERNSPFDHTVLQKARGLEEKTLRTDIGTQGGYLISTPLERELIKEITEISPVRAISRTKQVGKKTIEMPKRTSILEASYEGETISASDSQSVYAAESLTTHRLTVNVPFTEDQLMDSDFDLEAEIKMDVSEAFAFKEGNKFVLGLGAGAKQPEGFASKASLVAAASVTGSAGTISGDDLLTLTGQLKVGYNPLFGFNRQVLAGLRTLKGSDGHYLWQMGLAPGTPGTLAGERYVVLQDMAGTGVASQATGLTPIVYADFRRGYQITDRTGLVMVRDNITRKKEAIVELCFRRWNHGQVVLDEAFKLLKIQ